MAYRSDLDAIAARHDALATEVATKTKELDQARTLLEEAKQRARLPVLPNLRIAAPCTADWNQMTGDDRVRACGQCNKHVYNLSSMTREEAEALIVQREGQLCVRYYARADGTIMLKDCAVGVRRRRGRRLVAAGAAALLAGAGGLAYKLTRPAHVAHAEPLMGAVSIMPPTDVAPTMGRVAIDHDQPVPKKVRELSRPDAKRTR